MKSFEDSKKSRILEQGSIFSCNSCFRSMFYGPGIERINLGIIMRGNFSFLFPNSVVEVFISEIGTGLLVGIGFG